VLFAGDSAHQVSPFGARGGNSGVQDADNLAWKLALVVKGEAPERLLDSYDAERGPAADENILASSRSTDFMSPKTPVARQFRDAVLALAERLPFARRLINSGRLSVASVLENSPLSTPDCDPFPPAMRPGSAAADAPVRVKGRDGWLLEQLRGGFTGLYFGDADPPAPVPVIRMGADAIEDRDGLVSRRYDGRAGTLYLFRPDQHVAARWRSFDAGALRAALARATGKA
jgi:3-(3-hydroxy-phenyl)propionate hydroxylase